MNLPFKQHRSLFTKYLKPHASQTLLLSALILGNIGLQLVNPQIVRHFLDAAQAAAMPEVLGRAALLFIGVAVGQQIIGVWATYVSENLGWTTTNALRADLAEHCLHPDLAFHAAHTPGEMVERLEGDVTALANFFARLFIQVAGNGLLLVGVLVVLFCEDWRAGGALGLFVLVALLVLLRLRGIAVPHWAAERQAGAELFSDLEERLQGVEDIRTCGAQAHVLRGFYRLLRTWMQKSIRAGLMAGLMTNAISTLVYVGPATALAVGAYLYLRGAATLGTVYLVFQYSSMLTTPINMLTTQMQDWQRAGASIGRVQALFAEQSKVRERALTASASLPHGALAVAFEGVSFGYAAPAVQPTLAADGAKGMALHDLSFYLAPGKVLGLLGRTGSGKTTLTRLLFRFYDPDRGAVRLGIGPSAATLTDLRALRLDELRCRVGLVTQEIQLFNATVRENLALFDPALPDVRIVEALEALGLGAWYRALPQGLDTLLAPGGGGLSAGEAQLLAFARVFLRDPGLVILDEASSRLDPATEQRIERAVDKLLQNRTGILIAHHLATVQRADDILILEEGRVREYGPRAALAADPASRFHHLLQTGLQEVLA